jgi:hypothetical protein
VRRIGQRADSERSRPAAPAPLQRGYGVGAEPGALRNLPENLSVKAHGLRGERCLFLQGLEGAFSNVRGRGSRSGT